MLLELKSVVYFGSEEMQCFCTCVITLSHMLSIVLMNSLEYTVLQDIINMTKMKTKCQTKCLCDNCCEKADDSIWVKLIPLVNFTNIL